MGPTVLPTSRQLNKTTASPAKIKAKPRVKLFNHLFISSPPCQLLSSTSIAQIRKTWRVSPLVSTPLQIILSLQRLNSDKWKCIYNRFGSGHPDRIYWTQHQQPAVRNPQLSIRRRVASSPDSARGCAPVKQQIIDAWISGFTPAWPRRCGPFENTDRCETC